MRHSLVPWLSESDLTTGPKSAWAVEYVANQEYASCWQVPIYAREESSCAYLLVHAVRGNGNDGGHITLSISWTPRYDIYAKECFVAVPAQSGPQRHKYRVDADCWRHTDRE